MDQNTREEYMKRIDEAYQRGQYDVYLKVLSTIESLKPHTSIQSINLDIQRICETNIILYRNLFNLLDKP